MSDTILGEFPNVACSDCGRVGQVQYKHWGEFVPQGEAGHFCGSCMFWRKQLAENGNKPQPLGYSQTRAGKIVLLRAFFLRFLIEDPHNKTPFDRVILDMIEGLQMRFSPEAVS